MFMSSLLSPQAAFDKLTLDNADQKAQFDNELAKAAHDASDQKALFDNRMAKAALDASDQKVSVADYCAELLFLYPSLHVHVFSPSSSGCV